MATFTTKTEPDLENEGVLASWKGIAAYFGCNVRTAKRWERERGLPVRRAPGKKSGTVFARASELDAWLESREKEPRLDPVRLTSGSGASQGNALQNKSPLISVTPLPVAYSDKRKARQASYLRSQSVVFAAFLLLISAAAMLWKIKDRQSAATTTFSRLDQWNAKTHVPAPTAVDLFLRGRYYWNLRTADGLAKAIDSYTQAIVTDPSYAEAYAGLAESYDLLPQFAQANLGDSLSKAEQAADRAIALNPNLVAAHRAKAFALFYGDWDIAGSKAEFKHALELDPGSAQTHQWYAGTLQCTSEGAEAIRQIDEAVRLDPTSPAIVADAALLHADFGDFRSGVKDLRELEQTQPTLASPAQFLSVLDFATAAFPAYVDDLRRLAAITHDPDDLALAKAVEQGWARSGRTGLLEARAGALKVAFDHGTGTGFLLGQSLLLLQRRREALFYFNASLNRHAVQLLGIDHFSWAKKLSGDPGYAALFAQIHQRIHEAASDHPEQTQVAFELPQ
jgi:tetratricopeptide (TPR) repeat protein